MPKAEIIGLGRSGNASARLLYQKGWTVTINDRSTNDSLIRQKNILETEGITVKLGHTPNIENDQPDLIVVSPGVPWDSPVLVSAREKEIDTIGELELAWRYLEKTPWVGITGTNGKTTVTSLIAAIFQSAGLNAPACGNIGFPACELASHNENYDWIIAEISSYQIEASKALKPRIGVWTTFTPDHLARHKTLENYYNIKAQLLSRSNQQVFNGDDPYLQNIGLSQWDQAYWTSTKGKNHLICEVDRGVYIEDGWVTAFREVIMPISLFKMVGDHNQQNLLMAIAVARLAGIEKSAIVSAMTNFSGVPHRLELIRTYQGIDFINDSKATNYDASEVGLKAVKPPVILIAGGEIKEGDDQAWLQQIQKKTCFVLLIGSASEAFAKRLTEIDYHHFEIVETMANAVTRGLELALEKSASGVLLSPACASFDQYQSFEHRGEDFRQLCLNLS